MTAEMSLRTMMTERIISVVNLKNARLDVTKECVVCPNSSYVFYFVYNVSLFFPLSCLLVHFMLRLNKEHHRQPDIGRQAQQLQGETIPYIHEQYLDDDDETKVCFFASRN